MAKRSPHDGLLKSGRLSPADYDRVCAKAKESGCSVETALLESGISLDELGRSLAEHYRKEFVALEPGRTVDEALLKPWSRELWLYHNVAPLAREGGRMVVACENPGDLALVDMIERDFPRAVMKVAVRERIRTYLTGGAAETPAFHLHSPLPGSRRASPPPAPDGTPVDLVSAIESDEEGGVVVLANQLLIKAHREYVEVLQIGPLKDGGLAIRMLKKGTWYDFPALPGGYRQALINRLKLMAGIDPIWRPTPRQGSCVLKDFGGLEVKFRVAVTPRGQGEEDMEIRFDA